MDKKLINEIKLREIFLSIPEGIAREVFLSYLYQSMTSTKHFLSNKKGKDKNN